MIDTGAEVSLINSNLIDENKDKLKNLISISRIKLLNVNGRRFADSNKILNTKIRVLGEEFYGEFVVITNMRFDMILGEDLLTKLRAKIDMGERSMQLNGNKIKIGRINEVNGERANIGNINNLLNDNKVNRIGKVDMSTIEINIKEIPESYKINCPPKYENSVKNLIIKYNSLINYESRIAKGYMHKLIVDESKPFRCKSYPIPYNHRGQVNNEIENMLKANIIESAKTNYINPLVVVKKKNGTIRLCLDARILNQITKCQFDAPQNIDSMLNRIGKNSIFSKLDLKNSFWLIPLDPNSRKYTGFSIDGHIYQFKVVPFGLQSSSAALVRAIQCTLDKYESFCFHYIDDILIFSDNIEKHYDT